METTIRTWAHACQVLQPKMSRALMGARNFYQAQLLG